MNAVMALSSVSLLNMFHSRIFKETTTAEAIAYSSLRGAKAGKRRGQKKRGGEEKKGKTTINFQFFNEHYAILCHKGKAQKGSNGRQ